jgi:MFS family permease
MPATAKITLLLVVFVDVLGQGLVFPLVNTLLMEPSGEFLPKGASALDRHFDYGLVIGSFFLAWFLGVVYIAKLSDSIGRKSTMLICLGGALSGYVLTIVAFYLNSLWLLILGRVITGFTAGNQPVAQAAMIDGSTDAADRDRNMGYIVTGISAGLVGGPILGAVLADKSLLGRIASFDMPFYGASLLVAITIGMVLVFFTDIRRERAPYVFRPAEILETLWQVTKHRVVLMLMPAYLGFTVANVTFYIFAENYLSSAFGYGIVGSSAVMAVIGIAVAYSSTFLVHPAQQRFGKQWIVGFTLAVMAASSLAYIASPSGLLCYLPVFAFYLFFGIAYPTFLGIFSGSVSEAEQGWVMGVTTAVFTLTGGVMSLIGGGVMSIDIRLPFYIVMAAALLGLLSMALAWNRPAIRRLTAKPMAAPVEVASD